MESDGNTATGEISASYRLEPLESRLMLAAQLVKDINTNLVPVASVGEFMDLNGTAFFSVAPSAGDWQLWKSDGTAGGTAMLKDLGPLATYDSPRNFLTADGKVFFIAGDRTTNLLDLWVSDGTPQGTVPLHQVPRLGVPLPVAIAARGGVFFAGGSNTPAGTISVQLWETDGTAAGTVMLTASNPLNNAGTYLALTGADAAGTFYYAAQDFPAQQIALWKSDGTPAGTSIVEDLGPSGWGVGNFRAVGSTVYFTSGATFGNGPGLFTTGQLMKSDGSATGTVSVATINYAVLDQTQIPITSFDGSLLLALPNFTDRAWHLWRTDNDGTGVTQLSPASLGPAYSSPGLVQAAMYPAFHEEGGKLFFFASDAAHGMEPWVSDGTAAGTMLIDDVNPGPSGSAPAVYPTGGSISWAMAVLNEQVYFEGNNGTAGWQLWRTDGTAQGTAALPGITPSGAAVVLRPAGGLFYLFRTSDPNGTILQVADGTGAAPIALRTLSGTDTEDSQGYEEGAAALPDGSLLFAAADFDHGSELWRSDGTAGGTSVLDITPGPAGTFPTNIKSIAGHIYFENNSMEALWTTDGTVAGTIPLASGVRFVPGSLTDVNGTAYFFATGTNNENELWKSNGTPQTTVMVAVIDPTGRTPMSAAVAFQGLLYFTAATGAQLWRSDGTAQGTFRIFSGLGDYSYSGLVAAGRRLFFAESLGTPGNLLPPELFETDGTIGGTIPVPNAPSLVLSLAAVGDAVYFIVNGGSTGLRVYHTDGTAAGTWPVTDPAVMTGPANLASFNGTLLFTDGGRLWRADGSPGGFVALSPASATVNAADLIQVFDNQVYFTAQVGFDEELWVSDGTPAGTQPVATGFTAPRPSNLATAGGNLYFQARTQRYGREVWELPLPSASVTGRVFNDANHNGAEEPGEVGLGEAIVYLDVNGNGSLDSTDLTTTTGASGTYIFRGLAAGDYTVRVATSALYRRTTPAAAGVAVMMGMTSAGPVFGEVLASSVLMDFSYLLTLAQHYGQKGTFATGDVNGDDTVNFSDLLLMAQNYGHPLGSITVAAALSLPSTSPWLGRVPTRKVLPTR